MHQMYAGRWRLLYCHFLFVSYVRVYYCSTLSILRLWRMYPYSYNVHAVHTMNSNALNNEFRSRRQGYGIYTTLTTISVER
jgi:hypothetical protein